MDGVWIAAIAAGVLVAIILSQWFFLVRYKKRNRTNLERMESLEKEHRYMESILETNRDAKVNAILRHRASLISRLIAAEISGDTEVNESVIEEIGTLVSEREEFMRQNRMLYERWQPDMIERLRACGLTDEEIEVCCLYAMVSTARPSSSIPRMAVTTRTSGSSARNWAWASTTRTSTAISNP